MSYDAGEGKVMEHDAAVMDPEKSRRAGAPPGRSHGWWHTARVRAWERHGVYLDTAWCSATLDTPLSPAGVRRIRERSGNRVVLAVDGDVLVYRFPHGHHDRARRGQVNPGFLDPVATGARLAELLAPLGDVVDVVLLRLGRISPNEGIGWGRMVELLCPWLDALPPHRRYVLESADPSYVVPGYLECLRQRNVGHLLRHDARGSLLETVQVPGILTAGPVLVRKGNDDDGLWPTCQGGNEEWVLGVLATVRQCVERGLPVCVSVPPSDLQLLKHTAVWMDGDLAKLSPFKKRLAA
jgi:hypothetical protein